MIVVTTNFEHKEKRIMKETKIMYKEITLVYQKGEESDFQLRRNELKLLGYLESKLNTTTFSYRKSFDEVT